LKVLILGCNGMLGHKLYQVLEQRFDVTGTIRGGYQDVERYGIFEPSHFFTGVDAREMSMVGKAILKASPDVVINCIGIVKSISDKTDRLSNIWLNSVFPHQLAEFCRSRWIRLIHISTDCVFSGLKGNYNENDLSDALDIYGKTKYLGEITGDGVLTVRTSFIGRELAASNGLLEWFVNSRGGTVSGYENAVFSGFPTLHIARILGDIIEKWPDLSGLFHVASEPMSKYQLLILINKAMKLNIKVNRTPEPRYDRSLDATRFRKATGFKPLSWEDMVGEMARDAGQYNLWR
jgi:dTDP-4-dehydrorhamnose reductase